MPGPYSYKELFTNISDADMLAYYDLHRRLMTALGKEPKTHEAYAQRALELLADPNGRECLIKRDDSVIGWLSIDVYESDNHRKCFCYSGDLLEPVDDADFYNSLKSLLSGWQKQLGPAEGYLKVTTPYNKNMADFLLGEFLDEQRLMDLHINSADMPLMEKWINDANLTGLHEVFSIAVPESYMGQYVAMMNSGTSEIPTNMRPFTQYTSIETERQNKIDREKGGRKHLLLILVNDKDELVAMTNLTLFKPPLPAKQWLTYVIPELRRKGLAKYLKAKMLKHIVEAYPDVTVINTDCYVRNTPMIGLNEKMGYVYTKSHFDYKIVSGLNQ